MASSETQIAKRALQKIGAASILVITEDSNNARECNLAFATVRDAELNRHIWRFSVERVSLPALSATPDSDYAYQYQLPGDFLRLIPGGDIRSTVDLCDYRSGVSAHYSIEGRKLRTNLAAPLAIRYVKRITDTTLFTPAFDEAFASRLAYEICYRITQSTEKLADCRSDYKMAIREAIMAQALELPTEAIADDTWVMARAQ